MNKEVNLNFYVKILLLLTCWSLATTVAFSQQDALYSQYMFNGLVINPAYAGSSEALNVTASARKQWVGMDGSPSTQTLSVHTPLKKEKIALGLMLINDNIGVTHQFGITGIYAYRISWKEKNKFSMGLQFGGSQFTTKYSVLATRAPGDNSFSADQVSGFIPSLGAGLYYNNDKFYLGLSVPYLLNNLLKDTLMSSNIFQRRHYLFTSGIVVKISPNLKIKPSVLIKSAQGVPVQVDLNTNLLIKEVLWLGLSFRDFKRLNFLTQVQLTDQLKFGYSYDFASGKTNTINKGSHEIVLNYNFAFVKNKVVTPRYF